VKVGMGSAGDGERMRGGEMVDKVIGGRGGVGGIGVGMNVMESGCGREGAKEGENPTI
jgi:hypothetical protein